MQAVYKDAKANPTAAGLLLFAIAMPQVTGPHSTDRPATMIALSLALPSVGER